jgi:hypothetical protein
MNKNHKYNTRKPGFIEKLDPDRVDAVNMLVTGELVKKNCAELYRYVYVCVCVCVSPTSTTLRRKRREAAIRTRKLDESEVNDMETKLQQTAMSSLLYDKSKREQLKTLKGIDEMVCVCVCVCVCVYTVLCVQVVRARASTARDIVANGFAPNLRPEMVLFDQRMHEIESVRKNGDKYTVTTVADKRQIHDVKKVRVYMYL